MLLYFGCKYERQRCRWDDSTAMKFREIGWEGVDWMHVAQNRSNFWALVNTVINLGFHEMREIF
jgi:hypothetical protein